MILEYLSYPFVRYALLAGVLIALCSSLLGVTLVLKRYSFIGDGLSHTAFGATAIASVLSVSNEMWLVLPITVLCAVPLLKAGQSSRVKGDAALAMLSVGAMALGYLLLNVFGTSANIAGDVCSTLFGSTSILTLKESDVWICLAMSLVVILIFIFYYNKIFAVTFDESFARATGVKTELYSTMIAVITAVIIVLAMKLVGALLTSALIVFPALTAMSILKSFKKVIIFSACYAIISCALGMLLSMSFSTPVGATIVVTEGIIFGLVSITSYLSKRQ